MLSTASTGVARRAATIIALVALAVGTAIVTAVTTAAPAAASGTETLLEGVTAAGDLATGGGKVYVAAMDRVVVADATGAVVDSLRGLPGAIGLAISPDAGQLYVALRDTAEVAVVDTATLAEVRRISLGSSHPCPEHLSLNGNQLWVGYGCGQWGGGVVTVDMSAASPEVVSIWADAYGAPVVAAAGGVLAAGETGLSPASVRVFEVDGSIAVLRGTVPSDWGSASNLQDLALTRTAGR
jgi:YVTN family beta-propeller protein